MDDKQTELPLEVEATLQDLMRESMELADRIGRLLEGEKIDVIHASMTVVVEFLVRHTGLDLDNFKSGIEQLREINDSQPPENLGSVTTAVLPPNDGTEN